MENELLKELSKIARQTEGDDEKKRKAVLGQLQRYSIQTLMDSFVELALNYSKGVGEKIVISVEQRDALMSLFRVKNPDETRGRKKSKL